MDTNLKNKTVKKKFFDSVTIKIVFGIAVITSVLLVFVNIYSIYKTRSEFREFVEEFSSQLVIVDGHIVRPKQWKRVDPEATFEYNLFRTTIIANIIGVASAIGLGYFISWQITNPLRKIQNGIKNLKENNYTKEIIGDFDGEFKELVMEFNNLSKELKKSEELRQNLISDISHDFKTPITSINVQLEGMIDELLKPDKARLLQMKSQIERLNNLVDQLQEYSRVRSQIANLKIEDIKIASFIQNIIDDYSDKLNEQNINVVVNTEENLILEADKGMVTRIFINIFDNILKYSKAKIIKIKVNLEHMIFEDDGIGVPEKDIKYLFERFYRVEKSRSPKSGGIGLGLAIVKDICDAHGWKVIAENAEPTGLRIKINLKEEVIPRV